MGMFSKVNNKTDEVKEFETLEPGAEVKNESADAKEASATEVKAENVEVKAEATEEKGEHAPIVEKAAEKPEEVEEAPKATEEKPVAPAKPRAKKAAKPKVEPATQEPVEEAPAAEEGSAEDAPAKTTYTGKFEIKKTKDNRFFFNLQASNRVYIATSQIYSSVQSAMTGIKSVINNAEGAPVEDQTLKNFEPVGFPKWEIYLDKAEQFRFRLCASNGNCVCHSQGYTTKHNCKKGIESIIKSVKNAEIEKTYLIKAEE